MIVWISWELFLVLVLFLCFFLLCLMMDFVFLCSFCIFIGLIRKLFVFILYFFKCFFILLLEVWKIIFDCFLLINLCSLIYNLKLFIFGIFILRIISKGGFFMFFIVLRVFSGEVMIIMLKLVNVFFNSVSVMMLLLIIIILYLFIFYLVFIFCLIWIKGSRKR